ncbi:MAG: hypothetical protein OEM28_03895 [Nitrosopumilus sp.]|nr:hypothetical protein [Nitrosopumilus sp.]MDH3487593.1 hypothetical protein [Nitrosopumilus sp.]
MWTPKIFDYSKINSMNINSINIDSLINGKVPAIIIQNVYDKKMCKKIVDRLNFEKSTFLNGESNHIGPFLMSYATRRNDYFDDAKKHEKIFESVFSQLKSPTIKIREAIGDILPDYSISSAKELKKFYSCCIIRIHKKGKLIPIHKDDVKYEGIEFGVSKIDHQISCVLHLQESESGGDVIIFKKKWVKENEKFRNIDFGYSSQLVKSTEFCKIPNLKSGDLVLINPNYYHMVTKITGNSPRITLGMFLGIFEKENSIIAWA